MTKITKVLVLIGLMFSAGLAAYAGSCSDQCSKSTNSQDCSQPGAQKCCKCCCTAAGYAICGQCAPCGQESCPDGCADGCNGHS
jgi:hypothetical protein